MSSPFVPRLLTKDGSVSPSHRVNLLQEGAILICVGHFRSGLRLTRSRRFRDVVM